MFFFAHYEVAVVKRLDCRPHILPAIAGAVREGDIEFFEIADDEVAHTIMVGPVAFRVLVDLLHEI